MLLVDFKLCKHWFCVTQKCASLIWNSMVLIKYSALYILKSGRYIPWRWSKYRGKIKHINHVFQRLLKECFFKHHQQLKDFANFRNDLPEITTGYFYELVCPRDKTWSCSNVSFIILYYIKFKTSTFSMEN